jgi:Tfp pilus assembly ATPase PilU
MDQLLQLLTIEKAKQLHVWPGRPPIMVLDDEEHSLQGPAVTGEDAMRLLRSVATSRQIRDLREIGEVSFVYTMPDRSPFVIRAWVEEETVAF